MRRRIRLTLARLRHWAHSVDQDTLGWACFGVCVVGLVWRLASG